MGKARHLRPFADVLCAGPKGSEVVTWSEDKHSGRGKFMPLSPKTMQIQSVISRVKEELERQFSAFDAAWAGFLVIKYQLLKIYSFSYSRSTKFPKIFDLISKQKNYAILTPLKLNTFLLKC